MSGLTRAKDGKAKLQLDDDIAPLSTAEADMAHHYIRTRIEDLLRIAKTRIPALINPEAKEIPPHLDGMLTAAKTVDERFETVRQVCDVLGGPNPPQPLVDTIATWVKANVSDDQLNEYGVDMTVRYLIEADPETPMYIRKFAKDRPTVYQILASWKLYDPLKWLKLRQLLREYERGLIDDKTFIMRMAQCLMKRL